MPEAWKELEGRVINREFRLGDYLGGSEDAGIFLTQYGPESLKAAVKLIPIGRWDPATVEAKLSLLQSARELSHPHLLKILQAGRATIDDRELLFVAMEYADEDLSQFLPSRALEAGEVNEMTGPTLDALAYLHSKGFVHGHLKPANVMAVADQLKLSSDGISRIGEPRPGAQAGEYDAPEVARGENSAASDIWSLGMLLVMTLTQRLAVHDSNGEPVVTGVPTPFGDIARHCLQPDPRSRWALADIAERLGFTIPTRTNAAAKTQMRQEAVSSRPVPSRAATGPQIVPQQKATAGARDFPYRRRSNTGAYVAVAIAVLIVAIVVGPRLFRGGPVRPQADAQAQGTTGARVGRPTKAVAQVNDSIRHEAGTRVASLRPTEKAEVPTPASGKAARRSLTPGQVAQQVVPDVPKSARDTIRGTVRVGVRISVDSAGNVTEAELDSAGPSQYFAHLALEAAQQWRFEPPKVEGRNVLSDWLLRFQFTGEGTKVIPVQSDP